jgi:hypothetical protein
MAKFNTTRPLCAMDRIGTTVLALPGGREQIIAVSLVTRSNLLPGDNGEFFVLLRGIKGLFPVSRCLVVERAQGQERVQ